MQLELRIENERLLLVVTSPLFRAIFAASSFRDALAAAEAAHAGSGWSLRLGEGSSPLYSPRALRRRSWNDNSIHGEPPPLPHTSLTQRIPHAALG